jgi:Family of unknown function (DUF6521)
MNVAHDIFAETNPAFCACALVAFTASYVSLSPEGPEIPAVYLSLPIALSGDMNKAFEGTNKNTGLFEWLERNPQVQIDLSNRLNSSMSIVTEAIRFGCFTNVIQMNANARLNIGDKVILKSALTKLTSDTAKAIKHAERLGYWFAMAGSTRSVFNMMGITV